MIFSSNSSGWVMKHSMKQMDFNQVSEETYKHIRENFSRQYNQDPVLSIVVVARNEDKNMLACLSSLSELKCKYPYEVIVVNNNSSDHTQDIIDRCGVKSILQPMEGPGYAREAGIWLARGKYHLCANANTIYPEYWADEMLGPLERGEAICSIGSVGHLNSNSRTSLVQSLFGFFRELVMPFYASRRPEQVAKGTSLAFFTRMGQQVGWSKDQSTDEIKLMVIAMKRYGKIKYVNSRDARAMKLPEYSGQVASSSAPEFKRNHAKEMHEMILN